MGSMRHHFDALLKTINPSKERQALASKLPADVRTWLKEHEFETTPPHTRLAGSWARRTAILNIRDVDVLLSVPPAHLERSPNAVLLEVRRLLAEFPDTQMDAVGQRRSIRLEFPLHSLDLDIVPVVAENGLASPLLVPDRRRTEWIASDPLGYAKTLTEVNEQHGGKVVPLVKLVKGWRDVQMTIRRPKSYALEVLVVNAIVGKKISTAGESMASILGQFFASVTAKFNDLMEQGHGTPRILDPQLGHLITGGWERSHFETFMRRAREADRHAHQALQAADEADASAAWQKVFGDLWPNREKVTAAVRAEAALIQPGVTAVASTGHVIGGRGPRIPSRPTRFHGA